MVICPSDDGSRVAAAGATATHLVVGDNLDPAVLVDTHAGVGGAQINANHSAKLLLLRSHSAQCERHASERCGQAGQAACQQTGSLFLQGVGAVHKRGQRDTLSLQAFAGQLLGHAAHRPARWQPNCQKNLPSTPAAHLNPAIVMTPQSSASHSSLEVLLPRSRGIDKRQQ